MLPAVLAYALEAELCLIAAEGLLDLPSAGVPGDDPPGLFEGSCGHIGKEVPALLVGPTRYDQPERDSFKPDPGGDHPNLAPAAESEVPQFALRAFSKSGGSGGIQGELGR